MFPWLRGSLYVDRAVRVLKVAYDLPGSSTRLNALWLKTSRTGAYGPVLLSVSLFSANLVSSPFPPVQQHSEGTYSRGQRRNFNLRCRWNPSVLKSSFGFQISVISRVGWLAGGTHSSKPSMERSGGPKQRKYMGQH